MRNFIIGIVIIIIGHTMAYEDEIQDECIKQGLTKEQCYE